MEEKVFEHGNFVWLDHEAVLEILEKRKPASSEAMTVYNNLLRWSLYQLDRNACSEVDDKTGNDIPIEVRLDWIKQCREGSFDDYLSRKDLTKYLDRGLQSMPWTELSQQDFLKYVVREGNMMSDEKLLKTSIEIMEIVVQSPDRLQKSAFQFTQPVKSKPMIKSVRGNAVPNGKITSLFTRRDSVKKKDEAVGA